MCPKRKLTRGYPVAILLGLEENKATIWQVFSKRAKPLATVSISENRSNQKALYNFHESIIRSLKQTLRDGVGSVIVSSQPRTTCYQEFINYVNKHQTWLRQSQNRIFINEISGSAATQGQVSELVNSDSFRKLVRETVSREADDLAGLLEKRLATSNREDMILFSIEEAEDLILHMSRVGTRKAEYLILTNKYLAENQHKARLNRLLQIALNQGVKTRVVDSDSRAGQRIMQFGGIVCLAKPG